MEAMGPPSSGEDLEDTRLVLLSVEDHVSVVDQDTLLDLEVHPTHRPHRLPL